MSSISDRYKTNTKTEVPTRSDGTVGIRATLNNMGISNDKIGYNEGDKTVTLSGKTLMKPVYIDEDAGVSYATPKEIQQSLVNYYSGTNNPIVKVSDAFANYAGQYGLSADALGYTNGTVTIGGTPLNVLYIDDEGKSWTFRDNLESTVYDYINSLNVSSPNDILREYNSKYLNPAYNLARSIMNRSEFSYDPDSDPVYQAYRNKYMIEGNRATRDTLAAYSGLTGGYTNSAAVTAAAQTGQYYMSQLTNVIPELAQQAYERYADSYKTDLDLLEQMVDLYDTAYGNAYSANNKTIANINSAAGSNVDRDAAAFEKYWDSLFNAQEYSWAEKNNAQDYDWTEILNGQQSTSNYLESENMRNENIMQQIYLQYYNKLLEAQLVGENLNNRLTQERINQLILQNMFGY